MNKLTKNNKRATVIIGSGFGDEGKGLMTDRAAAPFGDDCLVARFNGGAQAGHTVQLSNGLRHVHSHFGSGTLTGAGTFLSKYFVSNPLLYHREMTELKSKGVPAPTVFADDRGLVTTPYDMLLNQFAEQARGLQKHGSCGIGFGETIERCLLPQFSTTIADLADTGKLVALVEAIRHEWVPVRLNKLGIKTLTPGQQNILNGQDLRDNFIESATQFFSRIRLARPDILQTVSHTIFEGAQGLLLDQDFGWFPHVTRSNTGLKNAVQLAEEAGVDCLDVIYATRAYATRHGAGPLPHELPHAPYEGVYDATNVRNPYQDTLRFGWLDLDLLNKAVENDFNRYAINPKMSISRHLAVTCLDQLDDQVTFVNNERLCQSNIDDFIAQASRVADGGQIYLSAGPTRETITERCFKKNEILTAGFCKYKEDSVRINNTGL